MQIVEDQIELGSTVSGTLQSGSRVRYSLNLETAQTLRVFLDGQSLRDAYLRVYDDAGRMVYFNDDGGGRLDSLIQQRFEAGHYTIEAAGYADHYGGSYELKVTSPDAPVVAKNSLSNTLLTNSGKTDSIVSGGATKDNTLRLSGTLAAGTTVAIYDGETLLGTSDSGSSAWQISGSSWTFDTTALSDGTHTLTALFTGNGGVVVSAPSVTATIDTIVSGSISSTILTDSGSAPSIEAGGSTTDQTLGLSGTADAGSTVQIYDGGTLLGYATVDGTQWRFNTSWLGWGAHQLSAQISDSVGNRLTTDSVAVDLSAPTALSVLHVGETIKGALQSGSRVSYSLDLETAQTLRIFLDGQSLWDAYLRVYDGAGKLLCSNDDGGGMYDSLIQQRFGAGHYTIEAAGYRDAYSGTYALKVTSPDAPVVAKNSLSNTLLTNSGKTDSIVSGGATKDNTLRLSGTLAAGTTVAIYDGETLLGTSDSGSSAWQISGSSWTFDTTALSDGTHTLTALFTGNGGVVVSAPSVTATIDTIVSGSISSTILTDSGSAPSIEAGGSTTDQTLGLSGTADAGSAVRIYDGGTLLGYATVNGTQWTFNTPVLSGGVHHFSAQITDSVGNRLTTDSVTVDLAAPNYGNYSSTWSTSQGWGFVDTLAALERVLGREFTDNNGSGLPWGVRSSNFDDAWREGYTGEGVVVAVLDTGLDLSNADLTQNLSQFCYDFVDGDSDVSDGNGHGTFVASEIVAANNNIGLTGAAYGAELMALRVLDNYGRGSADTVCTAIRYAVDHGADVINLSLGGVSDYSGYAAALSYADEHNVLVVMAAGNSSSATPLNPAAYAQRFDGCLAVGSYTEGSNLANYSNRAGRDVPYGYVCAAGEYVQGYDIGNSVELWRGTSMAAPFVTAEAAILLSAAPDLSDEALAYLISSTCHNWIPGAGVGEPVLA